MRDDYFSRRMSSPVRLTVMELGLLPEFIGGLLDRLGEDRARQVPGLKRDLCLCKKLCGKHYCNLVRTAPEGTAEMIQRQVSGYEWRVERKSPVDPPSSQYVSMADLHRLISTTLENECKFCLKSGNDAKLCETRKMLRKFCDEPEPVFGEQCGYVQSALNNNGGKK